MADSSQTRIFGTVGVKFLRARWWLYNPILDALWTGEGLG